MSRVTTTVLAVGVVFALAGCAPLLEFNLFRGIDARPVPTAAEYETAEGLDRLGEDLNSPAVVEAMTPEVVAEIENHLWDTYLDDGVSGEDDQQAAILYADLALKTSEGEALVNNIVQALLDETIDGSVADLLQQIIPSEALEDQSVFEAMVNALLLANEAYLLLGASIDLDDDGEADDGATLPPDALPGDIAQKAIVAYTMRVMVDAIVAYPDPDMSEADALDELYLIATDDPGADTDLAGITPSLTQPTQILALIDYAGIPTPAGTP